MPKIFYFDLETTGLSWETNAIHQIAIIIEIDGVVKERIDWKVRPFQGAKISEEALKVGGVTLEQIKEYDAPDEVWKRLNALLAKYVDRYDKTDKFYLCGYNNRYFDDRFLRAWWERMDNFYFGAWFWTESLDVLVLASQYLMPNRRFMKNFKLGTVAQSLGIPVKEDSLHDGLYDVELTRAVYRRIFKLDLLD